MTNASIDSYNNIWRVKEVIDKRVKLAEKDYEECKKTNDERCKKAIDEAPAIEALDQPNSEINGLNKTPNDT